MTKKTLLEILKDVDDAVIYVDVDDDNAEYHKIFHIKNSITVSGNGMENEVTLFCY